MSVTADGVRVELHLLRAARAKAGDELMISYGDKSNEELLMLHGFCLPDNPHDTVMMHCPLPPKAQWDDVMIARMELMHVSAQGGGQRLSKRDGVVSTHMEPVHVCVCGGGGGACGSACVGEDSWFVGWGVVYRGLLDGG